MSVLLAPKDQKALEVADKRQIATRVLKANPVATCKDVEADAEWVLKTYGNCGGTILADGKEANGIAVEHKTKKLQEPTKDEMRAAYKLCAPFGGDPTLTIGFLQSVVDDCGGPLRAVQCLMRYESVKEGHKIFADMEADRIAALAETAKASEVVVVDPTTVSETERIAS